MIGAWTVQDAKAKLSKLLALARRGEPQRIGLADSCVVVSEAQWAEKSGGALGEWLVNAAPRGEPIELPSRKSNRGDPFMLEAVGIRKRRRKPRV